MNMFLLNILLAVLWMLTWSEFTIYSLAAGFALGYGLLGLYSRMFPGRSYGFRAWRLLSFAIYFHRILITANLQVAREILSPGLSMTPRMIAYPVEGLTPAQVTTLASTISLTPGTLSVDINEDTKVLYVHAMYAPKREDAIRDLDELRDRLIREVF